MVFEWFRETFGKHLKDDVDLSRRKFLKGAVGIASVLASFPFRVLAGSQKDFIEVTITRERNSIGKIVDSYCDGNKFLAHYNATTIHDGINRLVRIHNSRIRNPSLVRLGDRILIPKATLKDPIQEAAKIQETKPAEQPKQNITSNEWQSPFGGNKQIPLHYCYDGTPNNDVPNGIKRIKRKDGKLYPEITGTRIKMQICPHDLFTSDRKSGEGERHNALDCWCPVDTNLYPIKSGTVENAGIVSNRPKNGLTVKIRTDDGFTYLYIHMSEIFVKVGDRVNLSTCVGESGITGNATKDNPHVHITLRKNNKLVDPLTYLKVYIT